MQRTLIIVGLVIFLVGVFWPWIETGSQKISLFHLPGDVVIEKENFRFYFPIVSTLLISIIITIIIWLIRR